MKETNDKTVFVSEIRMWTACPKQLYFKISAEKKRHPDLIFNEKRAGVFENKIWREICLELPALVLEFTDENPDVVFAENQEFEERLRTMFQEIKREVDENNSSVIEIEKGIKELSRNIDLTIQRSGTALFEAASNPIAVEKSYLFEKADLFGAPPKVLAADGKQLPYLIKISKAPSDGSWESDRITAAAYLILLEKQIGRQFVSDSAIVDYFGDYRTIRIRPQDRRKVFRAIRKIRDIKKGKMPREKNIRLCGGCVYKEKCHVKAKSLFSKIFGEE
ncbi:MAG: Dna2/Cas4 domain-containing protein [Methanosarcinales archaeon]|jgi:CRISPR/Cas system-associated exonuclease Cas4 (RecB family)|nr:Dna2/Cas4 domain-containing protein [Methanosarcinales archaeon]